MGTLLRNGMNKLWQELQRRHVVRVGIVYVAITWVLAQVADLALDNFNAFTPGTTLKTFCIPDKNSDVIARFQEPGHQATAYIASRTGH